MTISHNNHYWGNIASDGAVVVEGNSSLPLAPTKCPLRQRRGLGRQDRFLQLCSTVVNFLSLRNLSGGE